jgi:hypothetical protein
MYSISVLPRGPQSYVNHLAVWPHWSSYEMSAYESALCLALPLFEETKLSLSTNLPNTPQPIEFTQTVLLLNVSSLMIVRCIAEYERVAAEWLRFVTDYT